MMVQMEEPRSRIKSSYYLDENVFATDSAMVSETNFGHIWPGFDILKRSGLINILLYDGSDGRTKK